MNSMNVAFLLNRTLDALRNDDIDNASDYLTAVDREPDGAIVGTILYAGIILNKALEMTPGHPAGWRRQVVLAPLDDDCRDPDVTEAHDQFGAVLNAYANDDIDGAVALCEALEPAERTRLVAHAALVTARVVP